jgi:hypothetical protein
MLLAYALVILAKGRGGSDLRIVFCEVHGRVLGCGCWCVHRISQEADPWPAPYTAPDCRWSSHSSLQKRERRCLLARWKTGIVFLPPYSPELKPDQFVWNDVNNNAVGRTFVHGPNDL